MLKIESCYDVIISEGGFAGAAAAMALRRHGLSVLLVEPRSAPGWEATRAYRLDWMEATAPLGQRFQERMRDQRGLQRNRLDAPICEMVLDGMLAEDEVHLLLLARVVGLGVEEDVAHSVRIASKSGEMTVGARIVLDASKAGLVWRQAGGPARLPTTEASIFTVILDGAVDLQGPVKELGTGPKPGSVLLRRGAWPQEVAMEYTVAGGLSEARIALPDMLAMARGAAPEIKDAIVTSTSMETFPVCFPCPEGDVLTHPIVRNLFGTGLSLPEPTTEDLGPELFRIGELAAEAIAETLPDLPETRSVGVQPSVPSQEVHDADVVVVGGGSAGAVAAIASARRGARTVLLEQGACLGGIGTCGGIHVYYHGVAGGIQDELDRRTEVITALFSGAYPCRGFHPEAKKVVLEQMAHESGVQVVYEATLSHVEVDHKPSSVPARTDARPVAHVTSLTAACPSGNTAWRPKVTVDSTGDADVAAMAGADFVFGREADGLPHAYSLSAGVLDRQRGFGGLNFDAGFCDPTDVVDMTRARRHGLDLYRHRPCDVENRLVYIAPLLGLRNARQIVGDYQLTMADEIEGREFPDVIGYAYSHYDNHAKDFENESDAALFWVWVLGHWRRPIGCEIPYRCLLPRNVEGLLVACRGLSVSLDAHHQLRMQRDMQRIGEAAGIAAAMAAEHGQTPRGIDVPALQAELMASGALGKPEPKKLPPPDKVAVALHESSWRPAPPPALPVPQLIERLAGDEAPDAVWRLVHASDAVPHLLETLECAQGDRKYWTAVALAGLGRSEAAAELIRCLEDRVDERSDARNIVPRWLASVCLLGRLKEPSAVPAICALLQDREADLDALIACVRALGRIGDPSAVPAIEALLNRPDIPYQRELPRQRHTVQVAEDARWQFDLAVAEALCLLGKRRSGLVEKHLTDDRLLVRRYAQRVLGAMSRGPKGED